MSSQELAASLDYELTASEIDPAHHAIVPSDDTQDLAFRSIRAIDPRDLAPRGPASLEPTRRTPKGIRPMIWIRLNETKSTVLFEVMLHTDQQVQVHVPFESWRLGTLEPEAVRAAIQRAYLNLLRQKPGSVIVRPGTVSLKILSQHDPQHRVIELAPSKSTDSSESSTIRLAQSQVLARTPVSARPTLMPAAQQPPVDPNFLTRISTGAESRRRVRWSTPDPDQGGRRTLDLIPSGQHITANRQRVTDLYPGGHGILEPTSNGRPIDNGIYIITNVHCNRFVYLEDANDNTPLMGHYRPEIRGARWLVKYWGKEQYSIENADLNRYANCGPLAGLKAFVEGHSRDQLWRIQARSIGEYTIATTDTRNLWMLPYDEPDTPVWLSDKRADPRCWWTFRTAEIKAPVDQNLTTQPDLSERGGVVAVAETPAIPDDMDLDVIDSERSLEKCFGLQVPNLSGQVRKLDKATPFSGTYSTVYPGMCGDEKVAIKVLRMAKESDNIERKFRRELLIWSRLRHVNILPLYGYFEDEEGGHFPSLISKWAEHGSAAQYITRSLRWDQRMSLFYDVAKGLNYLHQFEPFIVHADLKPQNVVVNNDGVGQLCDFGLSRFVQEELESGLTTTTSHTGTTRYLAYELVEYEDKPIPTTATDIYALGCLGLEFIYRIPPHASLRMNLGRIIRAIGDGIPPSKRPDNPEEVVPILWDLVESCWINAPEERPTATQVSDCLEKNLEALSESLEQCSWEPKYP